MSYGLNVEMHKQVGIMGGLLHLRIHISYDCYYFYAWHVNDAANI